MVARLDDISTVTVTAMAVVKFSIGDVVHHNKFDYRGVVVDVDAEFAGSDDWYKQVARSRPPKDQPWYRVLVDGRSAETYVAQRHLEIDADGGQIDHPLLGEFFSQFRNGRYLRRLN